MPLAPASTELADSTYIEDKPLPVAHALSPRGRQMSELLIGSASKQNASDSVPSVRETAIVEDGPWPIVQSRVLIKEPGKNQGERLSADTSHMINPRYPKRLAHPLRKDDYIYCVTEPDSFISVSTLKKTECLPSCSSCLSPRVFVKNSPRSSGPTRPAS